MNGPSGRIERRTLTPAVLASALFVAGSAVFAITFTAGRGGLEMPVASRGAAAVASPTLTAVEPSAAPSGAATSLPPTVGPTPALTAEPTTGVPTEPPPTVAPPTEPPTAPAASFDPNDPLLALPECPGHPGCFLYVVERNDTLSGIVTRYLLSTTVVLTLNPQLRDPSVVVTGTTLYLGRDPFVRLDPCPDQPGCFLYTVVAGDSLEEIAVRYGLTIRAIRDQNPGMPRPLRVGQVIELPRPA